MILRVLVVDDEEPMRLFVGRVLQDAGHEVAMAVSGDEAIAMLPALTSLDVLVTDEVMPRLPGHELARLVRAREPAVRVLYLTGFSDELFKEKRRLWADEAFLDKPCTAKALLEAVSLLFSGQ
ncbi:MAG: hypothetical protein DMF91_19890 [Acidobacteria bacterium]|nr:MAG: hypothetical protein DMF91_19890 [Acidobacteriota bacterium]